MSHGKSVLIQFLSTLFITYCSSHAVPDCIAYYPFNGNADDISGQNNDGTIHGAQLTSDRFGFPNSAYSFDGIDDYIEIPDNDTLDLPDDYSISIWIYQSQLKNGAIICKHHVNINYDGSWSNGVETNGTICSVLSPVYTSAGRTVTPITVGKWNHYVFTFNDNTNVWKTYLNGTLDTSGTRDINNCNTSYNVWIGREIASDASGGTNEFQGKLDDIRIYNIPITQSNVVELYNEVPDGIALINAAGETFTMGSNNGNSDEQPVHQVTFTNDFFMDTREVSQGQYQTLMAATYSGFTVPYWISYGVGDTYPVYSVNWFDAALYCNARTKAAGSSDTVYEYTSITGAPGNDCELGGLSIDLNKKGFRLPTEAEWEYACRGGTTTDFYWGKDFDPYPSTVADSNEVDSNAAWHRNSTSPPGGDPWYGTHPAGTRLENPFGLYDMSGNVWEWCNDWYGTYSSDNQTDPVGDSSGVSRVLRSGSWTAGAEVCRSARRWYMYPVTNLFMAGFRPCLSAE